MHGFVPMVWGHFFKWMFVLSKGRWWARQDSNTTAHSGGWLFSPLDTGSNPGAHILGGWEWDSNAGTGAVIQGTKEKAWGPAH